MEPFILLALCLIGEQVLNLKPETNDIIDEDSKLIKTTAFLLQESVHTLASAFYRLLEGQDGNASLLVYKDVFEGICFGF